ncbi:HU family DNA-binding protein [Streptomyces sp. CB01881]|uniref:HU family DNA-binding protein n=1 Tax=Streptomyces sp. CB01881 TaxID=2078691 RepID=UPI000CDBEFC9|nr:HU family DNA-binding protein [Streptomyces sp. CB01881]AUY50430.1 DNA-binding protein [Streptomyces sp. CB01881]TYC73817.1 HU family DNA-binding protein [Streptomyces sp. CB01881]
MNVNKNTLVDRVAPQLGSRRAAAEAVEVVLDTIARALAEGNSVSVTGFGTFEPAQHASRLARNPQTGDRVTIPARRVPRFRPHQRLKDLTDGRRALPEAGSSIRKDPKGTRAAARDAA